MIDQSKSLLTVQNAYDRDISYRQDCITPLSYDLSHHNLSIEEQIKLYKKIITETNDLEDVYFFLSGICNLEQINLDYHIIKQLAIEIAEDLNAQYSLSQIEDLSNISKYTLSKILTEKTISEDMAIRLIFTFNRQLLKELIT